MASDQNDILTMILKQLGKIDYIRPNEIPQIDLYMDQVTTFLNDHLAKAKMNPDEKIFTKTMINNYAKNDVLPPPENKKYSKEHLILLTLIYYYKNFLSISEIQDMLNPLTDKFFHAKNNKDNLDMGDIYNEIYASVKAQLSTVSNDITAKYNFSQEHFTKVADEEERAYLQIFSLICMLGFDLFLKKQVIENLIQYIKPEAAPAPESKKKEEKKKESKKDSKK